MVIYVLRVASLWLVAGVQVAPCVRSFVDESKRALGVAPRLMLADDEGRCVRRLNCSVWDHADVFGVERRVAPLLSEDYRVRLGHLYLAVGFA